jgi:hypothetical protein
MIAKNGDLKLFVLYAIGCGSDGCCMALPCNVSFWSMDRAVAASKLFAERCSGVRGLSELQRIVIVETTVELHGNEFEFFGEE